MNKEIISAQGGKLALTRDETAKALSTSVATVDRLTARGLLRPSRATYRPIYSVAELVRFLSETTVAIDSKGGF